MSEVSESPGSRDQNSFLGELHLCVRVSLSRLHAWPLVAGFIFLGRGGEAVIVFKQVGRAGSKRVCFRRNFSDKYLIKYQRLHFHLSPK